jgi:flagellar basal body-associated protein FliL
MKRTTPTITIIIILAIVAFLVSCCTASYFTPQCPLRIMPSRATRSAQEAARRRQDDEAMAAAILQKEKNAAKKGEERCNK